MKLSQIKPNPNNPRTIKDEAFKKLCNSITEFPKMLALRPMVVDADWVILGGNMRYKALQHLGFKDIPDEWVRRADELTEDERRRFIIADNVSGGEWDVEDLAANWDREELSDWGVELPEWKDEGKGKAKKLSDRFIIPPFSVLDTTSAQWRERRNYWLSLGIKSELGREEISNNTGNDFERFLKKSYNFESTQKHNDEHGYISIFDPLLCELVYKWFNVPSGAILDPFAGGSVRGIVAAKLGCQYLGNDLRREQIEANRVNAGEVLQSSEIYPTWTCGNSLQIDSIAKGYNADLIFSCPPYADLEVYSDAKEDMSNMPYQEFVKVYREIIQKSCNLLKPDRFACFVVSEVRDKKGVYYNLVSDTIKAFTDAGLNYYNELILVNPIGTKALTIGSTFGYRKIGRRHQNVLVFYKGNPKKIKDNYPEIDLSYIENDNSE